MDATTLPAGAFASRKRKFKVENREDLTCKPLKRRLFVRNHAPVSGPASNISGAHRKVKGINDYRSLLYDNQPPPHSRGHEPSSHTRNWPVLAPDSGAPYPEQQGSAHIEPHPFPAQRPGVSVNHRESFRVSYPAGPTFGYLPSNFKFLPAAASDYISDHLQPIFQPFSTEVDVEAANRPCGGLLPQDSHQDVIIRSTESDDEEADFERVNGVHHYRQAIAEIGQYDNVETTPYYLREHKSPAHVARLDQYRYEMPVFTTGPIKGTDYEHFSTSTTPCDDYDGPIHFGTTFNPLVVLAIVRIAQRNMPYINFDSILNHLPNHDPNAAFARLPRRGTFIDDLKYKRKSTDIALKTIYIPSYYGDGRDCVGYCTVAGSMLFTPCTASELLDVGLGVSMGNWTEEPRFRHYVCKDGEWLDDGQDWIVAWHMVGDVWKKRMKVLTKRKKEGPRTCWGTKEAHTLGW